MIRAETGGLNQETLTVSDDIADVVGQSAVGERNVVAAFKDDDLGGFVESACTGCDGCSGGDSADDDKFHGVPLDVVVRLQTQTTPNTPGVWDVCPTSRPM